MNLADAVTIDAPVEQVFDCWAELARSPEHQKPTIERTRLTDGPPEAAVPIAVFINLAALIAGITLISTRVPTAYLPDDKDRP